MSVMVIEPLRVPAAVGVKVTLMVQEAPAATLEPQVLVWEKSPLAAMLEIVRATWPLFVRAIVSGELVVPTSWLPKSNDDGERAARGIVGALYMVTKAS